MSNVDLSYCSCKACVKLFKDQLAKDGRWEDEVWLTEQAELSASEDLLYSYYL